MKAYVIGLSVLALTAGNLAQAQTSAKVGIINIQMALVNTKDGQKAAGDLEAKSQPKRKAIEAKQNEINQLKDQLQKGQNALSDAAKQELVRNIDTKQKSLTRDTEDAQAELDGDQQKILQDLGGKMMAVIDKYAKDNGFILILDVSSPQTPVLFASTTIDITKDIIDLYDKNAGTAAPATSVPTKPATPTPTSTTPRPVTPAKPPAPATQKPVGQ
ncbi:MAG: OmpH family outer membrane protein [Acidobacteriaceae bacterium]|nr:OmpH family outer membrane protein [Acidobacteriaceae bacterium]